MIYGNSYTATLSYSFSCVGTVMSRILLGILRLFFKKANYIFMNTMNIIITIAIVLIVSYFWKAIDQFMEILNNQDKWFTLLMLTTLNLLRQGSHTVDTVCMACSIISLHVSFANQTINN